MNERYQLKLAGIWFRVPRFLLLAFLHVAAIHSPHSRWAIRVVRSKKP